MTRTYGPAKSTLALAARRSRRWLVVKGALASLGLTVSSAQGGYTLEVLVMVDSQPLADVPVRIRSAYLSAGEISAPTDGEGRVSFDVPSIGFYDVVVESDGFTPARATDIRVSDGSVNRVTVELTRRVSGGGSY